MAQYGGPIVLFRFCNILVQITLKVIVEFHHTQLPPGSTQGTTIMAQYVALSAIPSIGVLSNSIELQ